MPDSALRHRVAEALAGTTPVRGLTVRQPWASSIAHLGKRIENRGKVTTYTGLVLVHAGLQPDRAAMRDAPRDLEHLDVRGAVLAVARITGCHPHTRCGGRCSPWAQPGRWHWQLADVLALHEPVPATGALPLWHPTPELRHAIAVALAA